MAKTSKKNKTVIDLFIGIDPGKDAGIAIIDADGNAVFAKEIPYHPVAYSELLSEIAETYEGKTAILMVEEVRAIAKVSGTTNFSFGYNVGSIHSILALHGIPFETFTPLKWQKHLGYAKKLFPEIKKQADTKPVIARLVHDAVPGSKMHSYTQRGRLIDCISDSFGMAHYLRTVVSKEPDIHKLVFTF